MLAKLGRCRAISRDVGHVGGEFDLLQAKSANLGATSTDFVQTRSSAGRVVSTSLCRIQPGVGASDARDSDIHMSVAR